MFGAPFFLSTPQAIQRKARIDKTIYTLDCYVGNTVTNSLDSKIC